MKKHDRYHRFVTKDGKKVVEHLQVLTGTIPPVGEGWVKGYQPKKSRQGKKATDAGKSSENAICKIANRLKIPVLKHSTYLNAMKKKRKKELPSGYYLFSQYQHADSFFPHEVPVRCDFVFAEKKDGKSEPEVIFAIPCRHQDVAGTVEQKLVYDYLMMSQSSLFPKTYIVLTGNHYMKVKNSHVKSIKTKVPVSDINKVTFPTPERLEKHIKRVLESTTYNS